MRSVWAQTGFLAVACLGALLLTPNVQAQLYYEQRHTGLLPPFCKYTQGFRNQVPGADNRAEFQRYEALLAPMFNDLHHYCRGLVFTNQAILFERDKRQRLQLLEKSIPEFDYIIRGAPPSFVLLPEILTKKGENLVRLGRGPSGVSEYTRAIELKPDYWPPYAYLSDFYASVGDVAKAREWVQKGLEKSPQTKALQERLAKLNGQKSARSTAPPPAAKPTARVEPSEPPAVESSRQPSAETK